MYNTDGKNNVDNGIELAKKHGGFTFDPTNGMDRFKKAGYVVTVANVIVPPEHLSVENIARAHMVYLSVVLAFRNSTIGVYDNGDNTFSIDVNIWLPHTEQGKKAALIIGAAFNQKEIGELGEDGEYLGGHETGGAGQAPLLSIPEIINLVDKLRKDA